MKRLLPFMIILLALASGCAGNRKLIKDISASTRQDVFKDVTGSAPSEDHTILRISFSVKTRPSDYFPLVGYDAHGTDSYGAIINIDGQSFVLNTVPTPETLEGDPHKDPEAGTGMRYEFRKVIALSSGKHVITIAVPIDDVVVSKEVALNQGDNGLKIVPVYRKGTKTRHKRFTSDLETIRIVLNNNLN